MYTLDQVLRPEFQRSWHEAVAVVQEVAEALGSNPLPGPEDIHMSEDGTLGLGFASEAAGDPVIGLGSLLGRLLEGVDAPAALKSLAVDNAKTPPPQPTVAGFIRALAFFERPDRRADLKAVAVRLSGHQAAIDAEYELQRLRERIVSAEPEPETAPKEVRARPRMSTRQVAMAAIIVIALMGTFAGVQLVRGASLRAVQPAPPAANAPAVAVSTPTPAPPVAEAELKVAEAEPKAEASGPVSAPPTPVAKVASPVAQAAPPAAQAAPPAARTLPAVEPKNRVATRALPAPLKQETQRSAAGSRPSVAEAPAPKIVADRWPPPSKAPSRSEGEQAAYDGSVVAPPVSPPLPPLSEAGGSVWRNSPRGTRGTSGPRLATENVEISLGRNDAPGRVYSAADPEVQPARLYRSQLPQEPAADARTGYFELLVDEAGDVEFVRLLSPTHRYQDRILVAAAKAWKFKPAMLHGRPVKYRLSIPIILREPR